jgi:HTH-type transcriptional regulator / antitoxin HipB
LGIGSLAAGDPDPALDGRLVYRALRKNLLASATNCSGLRSTDVPLQRHHGTVQDFADASLHRRSQRDAFAGSMPAAAASSRVPNARAGSNGCHPSPSRPATIARMAQGKRISTDIPSSVHDAIRAMGAAAKAARTRAGEGQAAAAARLGVHVQTIARIESGEPGVAIGHVLGLLAQYGVHVTLQQPDDGAP